MMTPVAMTVSKILKTMTSDKFNFIKYLNTKTSVEVGELVVTEGGLGKRGRVDLLLVVLAYAVSWLDARCSPEIVAGDGGLVGVSVKELKHVAHVGVSCDAAHELLKPKKRSKT